MRRHSRLHHSMMLTDAVGDMDPRQRRRMNWLWQKTIGELKTHLGLFWSLYLWKHV